MSKNSIEKQIIVNHIGKTYNLCYDITNVIKSFTFYDRETYTIKLKKEEINYIIKKVLLFYNNTYIQNKKYTHWGICIQPCINTTLKHNIHINNDMCNYCGDYCDFYFDNNNLHNHIPEKIKCICNN
jgi:hypothetical protein